jgi:hypothetical protein
MAQLPQSPDPILTRWKSSLDPVLANQLLQGNLLTSVLLAIGSNQVAHKLQRQPVGWIITDQTGSSVIYRLSWDNNFIVLNASQPVTINLWCF